MIAIGEARQRPLFMDVIDARHYLNHKDDIAIERDPARKMADFVTSAIAHASNFDRPEEIFGPACFKCRKRDNRRVHTAIADDGWSSGTARLAARKDKS